MLGLHGSPCESPCPSLEDNEDYQGERCMNCDIRQYALGEINAENAAMELQVCRIAERTQMVHNRTMATMEIFDRKLAEATKALADSQKEMNEWMREDNYMFFTYGQAFASTLDVLPVRKPREDSTSSVAESSETNGPCSSIE
ncbi:unnamed protein product [Heligmosomoides polygyrus]|uniref:GTD-binding domain-containing protein n=2 Tax=Heligmosomoides polygyrus TaxID=6339 RepID=A0A183FVT6_HELPZ|nr:unnamed protein product [Heligmosomoides polygyrus]